MAVLAVVVSGVVIAPSPVAASGNYGKVTVSGATHGTYVIARCEVFHSLVHSSNGPNGLWSVHLYGSNAAVFLAIDQTPGNQGPSLSVNLKTTNSWHVYFGKPDRQERERAAEEPPFESNASWEAGENYYLGHKGSGTLSISSDAKSGSVRSRNMVPTVINRAKRKLYLTVNWQHCLNGQQVREEREKIEREKIERETAEREREVLSGVPPSG